MTTADPNAPANANAGANASGGGGGATATPDKPKRGRKPAAPIENPDTLTGDALLAFQKKPEWEQASIRAKYLAQEAKRMKEAAKGTRGGGGGGQKTMPAPSFTLSHSFGLLTRAQFVPPQDGSQPEASAARHAKDFGIVAPLVATPAETAGLYELLDGRDFYLIPEGAGVPVVVVSGFPSPEWRDAAAAVYMAQRGANVFGLSAVLGRLRQRGWDDKALRSRLGFKAGEIEKYESLSNLPADIAQGVREGRISGNVALLVAKQAPPVREALAARFRELTADKADARLTEAHVEEARKARTSAAVQRDQPALSAAVGSVPANVEGEPPAPQGSAPAQTDAPTPPAAGGLQPAAPFVSTMPPQGAEASAPAQTDAPTPQGTETGGNPL